MPSLRIIVVSVTSLSPAALSLVELSKPIAWFQFATVTLGLILSHANIAHGPTERRGRPQGKNDIGPVDLGL